MLYLATMDITKISIHAPARGATFGGGSGVRVVGKFQSTLPRGERHKSAANQVLFIHFNPRSREGSDLTTTRTKRFKSISIHAPARGATPMSDVPFSDVIFQSTLPRGERRARLVIPGILKDFNPRSREGSDFNFI